MEAKICDRGKTERMKIDNNQGWSGKNIWNEWITVCRNVSPLQRDSILRAAIGVFWSEETYAILEKKFDFKIEVVV